MPRQRRRGSAWPLVVVLALAASGCASLPARSLAPDRAGSAVVIDRVPVRTFAEDRCGSGSLALVLNVAGDPVTEPELAASLPQTRGGVLSVDLMLAARQRGFEAALLEGDEETLRDEIRAGRPAILMLRLLDVPGHRHDVYHFVVVDGFVPEGSVFRVQYGDGQARWASLPRLDRAWKGAGHALLVVRPKGPPDELRRGLALEAAGDTTAAAEAYRRATVARPDSVRAWVDLGNAESLAGRRDAAESAYRSALLVAPADQDALNNLAWLLLEEGSRLEEAEALARDAIRAPGPGAAIARDTLGRVQLARGRCHDAAATFSEALDSAVPLPPESRPDLLEGLGQAQLSCGETAAARESFQAALRAGAASTTARSAQAALDQLPPPP